MSPVTSLTWSDRNPEPFPDDLREARLGAMPADIVPKMTSTTPAGSIMISAHCHPEQVLAAVFGEQLGQHTWPEPVMGAQIARKAETAKGVGQPSGHRRYFRR